MVIVFNHSFCYYSNLRTQEEVLTSAHQKNTNVAGDDSGLECL